MPKMSITVPHNLSEAEALARIKNLLGDLKREHAGSFSDLKEEWRGNGGTFSVKAMGMGVSGDLNVQGDRVELAGNLPLAATPFKGRIEQLVRERMEQLLA
jgi:hypothetical protein